jgi:hypothetical protein
MKLPGNHDVIADSDGLHSHLSPPIWNAKGNDPDSRNEIPLLHRKLHGFLAKSSVCRWDTSTQTRTRVLMWQCPPIHQRALNSRTHPRDHFNNKRRLVATKSPAPPLKSRRLCSHGGLCHSIPQQPRHLFLTRTTIVYASRAAMLPIFPVPLHQIR